VSLDPVNQTVRDDALRKRIARGSPPLQDQKKDFSTKRRCLMSPQKNTTITVVVGEHHYSQKFVIRTNRDMNKYRYERKCIEFSLVDDATLEAMSDATHSAEE
jgi:hypothetical protein